MLKTKKACIFLLFVLIISSILLVSCGQKEQIPLTASELLKQSVEALKTVDSVEGNSDTVLVMTAGEEWIERQYRTNFSNLIREKKQRIHLEIATQQVPISLTMFLQENDTQTNMYMQQDKKWYALSYDTSAINDILPDSAHFNWTSQFLAQLQNPQLLEDEALGEILCPKISGNIPYQLYIPLIRSTGFFAKLPPEQLSAFQSLFSGLTPSANVVFWLDPKSNLPLKMELNLTSSLRPIMDAMPAAQNEEDSFTLSLEQLHYTCSFQNYNNAKDVDLPAEALKASVKDGMVTPSADPSTATPIPSTPAPTVASLPSSSPVSDGSNFFAPETQEEDSFDIPHEN